MPSVPDRPDQASLLDPGFFVSLETATDSILAQHHPTAHQRQRSLLTRTKLPELYLVTRNYKLWSGFVSKVSGEADPLSESERFQAFVNARSPIHLDLADFRASLQFTARTLAPLTRARLLSAIRSPVHTLGDLSKYQACYTCCYSDRPAGCRARYGGDSQSCFTKCMAETFEE